MPVICSIQGSYAPPHLGHKGLAKNIAEKLLELYPDEHCTVSYMPSSNFASKSSISKKSENTDEYVSEDDRAAMLELYCKELTEEFDAKQLTFNVSRIEYEIQPQLKSTATIHTLRALRKAEPLARIIVAMGEDNYQQLPWWQGIEEWDGLIDTILMLERDSADPLDPRAKPSWAKNSYETMLEKPLIQTAIGALREKTVVLPAPPGYSSTELRNTLHEYCNEIDPDKLLRIKERIISYCGEQVAAYLLKNMICSGQVKKGGMISRRKKRTQKRYRSPRRKSRRFKVPWGS